MDTSHLPVDNNWFRLKVFMMVCALRIMRHPEVSWALLKAVVSMDPEQISGCFGLLLLIIAAIGSTDENSRAFFIALFIATLMDFSDVMAFTVSDDVIEQFNESYTAVSANPEELTPDEREVRNLVCRAATVSLPKSQKIRLAELLAERFAKARNSRQSS